MENHSPTRTHKYCSQIIILWGHTSCDRHVIFLNVMWQSCDICQFHWLHVNHGKTVQIIIIKSSKPWSLSDNSHTQLTICQGNVAYLDKHYKIICLFFFQNKWILILVTPRHTDSCIVYSVTTSRGASSQTTATADQINLIGLNYL